MIKPIDQYISLHEDGIVKRIVDVQADLLKHGLDQKGLNRSLDEMRRLLENEIPKLRTEISKRTIFVQSINVLLGVLGILLLLFIFLPNNITHDLLTDFKAKIDFVNSAMSILVGLFVSFVSVSLWAKKQAQNSIRQITDDIHQLIHRIDMYQLGKKPEQIVAGNLDVLKCYINGIFIAIQICGKMAALVYHNSDDDSVTQSARHLEIVANHKSEIISYVWRDILHN